MLSYLCNKLIVHVITYASMQLHKFSIWVAITSTVNANKHITRATQVSSSCDLLLIINFCTIRAKFSHQVRCFRLCDGSFMSKVWHMLWSIICDDPLMYLFLLIDVPHMTLEILAECHKKKMINAERLMLCFIQQPCRFMYTLFCRFILILNILNVDFGFLEHLRPVS